MVFIWYLYGIYMVFIWELHWSYSGKSSGVELMNFLMT